MTEKTSTVSQTTMLFFTEILESTVKIIQEAEFIISNLSICR